MITVNIDSILGPSKYSSPDTSSVFTYYNLDDLNDSAAFIFCIPETGTITEVGFLSRAVGTPPSYNIALNLVNTSGNPIPQIDYAGSDPYSYLTTDTNLLWNWFTLPTPATGAMGDIVALTIYPPYGNVPNTSNYLRVVTNTFWTTHILPRRLTYATSWGASPGYGYWGIKYNDGTVYGISCSGLSLMDVNYNSSPDEVGGKFTVPINVNCVGMNMYAYLDTDLAVSVYLYDSDDTVLRSIEFVDVETASNWGSTEDWDLRWSSPITLTSGATYRLTIKNTSNVAGTGYQIPVMIVDSQTSKDNNTLDAIRDWSLTYRTDGGAWTDVPTHIPVVGIRINAIMYEETTSSGSQGTGGAYAYVG